MITVLGGVRKGYYQTIAMERCPYEYSREVLGIQAVEGTCYVAFYTGPPLFCRGLARHKKKGVIIPWASCKRSSSSNALQRFLVQKSLGSPTVGKNENFDKILSRTSWGVRSILVLRMQEALMTGFIKLIERGHVGWYVARPVMARLSFVASARSWG